MGQDQHNLSMPIHIDEIERDQQEIRPVSRYEELQGRTGQRYRFIYNGDKIAYIKKAHNRIREYTRGKGRILWSGLPIEQSQSTEAIRAIYQEVLAVDGHDCQQESPFLMAQQPLKQGRLTLIVSESSQSGELELEDGQRVQIEPGRAGAILHKDDGNNLCFGGVHLL